MCHLLRPAVAFAGGPAAGEGWHKAKAMHTHTSRGNGQAHRWARWDLGRWHRWTVADGRYADYRSHRMADGCCADGTARTMGLRRCEPRGAHLRSDQCLADCSTTFGTRWGGRGSWAGCRAWQGGAAAAPPGWRTRGVLCAGSPPPLELCKLCPGAACCKAHKPTPLQGGKAALVCGGAFVERYRGWLGLRRPYCISY